VSKNELSEQSAIFFARYQPRTPCLVLDLAVVAQRYCEIRAAMPFAIPYYAVKACPQPAVIGLLAQLGACFDVASPAEIDLCLKHGATPESLSYGSTIKKASDISYAYRKGIRLFAFDNIRELEKLAKTAPGASVYCRLLAGSAGAR